MNDFAPVDGMVEVAMTSRIDSDTAVTEALKVAQEVLRARLATVATEAEEGRDPPLTLGNLIDQLITVVERYSLTALVTVDDPDTGLAVEVTRVEFWPMKGLAVLRTNGYPTAHPSVFDEMLVKVT